MKRGSRTLIRLAIMHQPQASFLFDLDGTLVDSVYQHVLAWNEALDAEGIKLSVWRIHRKIGMSGGLLTNMLLRETGLKIDSDRKVEALRTSLSADRSNMELRRRLAIAERIHAKSHYYEVAREFGRLVGSANHGARKHHTVIITGGGPGMMEAANRGAFDVGAKSVGLNISLPHEQYPNPYVTPELCFSFHYFALRKLHFLLRAKALVAFPGGYGTFDELFEVLTLVQTRKIKPIPVVLVGEAYWRRAVDMDFLVDEGVIDPEDRDLFWFAETARGNLERYLALARCER